jgi:hypothetical protein
MKSHRNLQRFLTYLSVNFEPDVTLSLALNNRSHSHKADNKGLALFDRDMHLFAYIWATKEIARRDDTGIPRSGKK